MRTFAELGTVLGVWAHPDDEAYLSAGMMALARDAGNRVVVATATYGELGSADSQAGEAERLAVVRAEELVLSLAAVGVDEHRFLGYSDGGCASVPAAAGRSAVAALIDEVAPDTIVTFGPEGMTGHADHVAVSEWTTAAWRATGRNARLLYPTFTPAWHEEWGAVNREVGIWMSGSGPVTAPQDLALAVACDPALADRKLAALQAHASQTGPLIDLVGADAFKRWWSGEFFAAA
jgi:LmbE family N-acetylglucosaminyl deacetylase